MPKPFPRSILAVFLPLAASACRDPGDVRPCAAELGGECIGLPQHAVCGGDYCTDDAPCSAVIEAKDDVGVADAVGRAAPGDCIALAPGAYAAIALPPGVSLLGKDADEVLVAGLSLGQGDGVLIRGLEVAGGGVEVGSVTGVRMDGVRVTAGPNGISARAGSALSVSRSELLGAAGVGLYAEAAASIAIESSIVADARQGGVRIACDPMGNGCDCSSKTSATLNRVLLRGNSVIGVALDGALASIDDLVVRDSLAGWDNNIPMMVIPGGAGMSLSGCTELSYGSVSVSNMLSYGVLFDSSSLAPDVGASNVGIVVTGAELGILVQQGAATGAASVTLVGVEVSLARGIGMRFGQGVVAHVTDAIVRDTAMARIPVAVDGVSGGSAEIGYGVLWTGGASVTMDGVAVSGSGLLGVLIDGPVGANSSIANLALSGGDEAEGVIQQGVSPNDAAPVMDGSAVLTRLDTAPYAVPAR